MQNLLHYVLSQFPYHLDDIRMLSASSLRLVLCVEAGNEGRNDIMDPYDFSCLCRAAASSESDRSIGMWLL